MNVACVSLNFAESADHVAAAAGGRAKRNHPLRLPRLLRVDGQRRSSGRPAGDDDGIDRFPVQLAEILKQFRPGISVRPSVRRN